MLQVEGFSRLDSRQDHLVYKIMFPFSYPLDPLTPLTPFLLNLFTYASSPLAGMF